MDGNIMCRVSSSHLEEVSESFPPEELTPARSNRIDRRIRAEIHRAEEKYEEYQSREFGVETSSALSAYTRFTLRRPRAARFEIDPAIFLCPKCESFADFTKEANSGDLSPRSIVCPRCKISMGQVVFVFTHSRCGAIEKIKQPKCKKCHKLLTRLHIDRDNLYDSRWICSNCGANDQELIQFCGNCSADGLRGGVIKMLPMPATSAVKPMSLTIVDIDDIEDWRKATLEWLNITGKDREEVFLSQFPNDSALRRNMEKAMSDPDQKKLLIQEDMDANPDRYQGVGDALVEALNSEPSAIIKDHLSEFAGALRLSEDSSMAQLAGQRQWIKTQYGLEVRYIPDLKLKRLLYGYVVGTNDVAQAKLQLFSGPPPSRYVLGNSLSTEALLFLLDPDRVASWLSHLYGAQISTQELKQILLIAPSPPETDPRYAAVQVLLHTISHLLMRNSEIYSGVGRDALAEQIFTPRLAFMIYSQDGSELGALRTTFESGFNFINWLLAARELADKCPHGDVCLERGGACHACLYVAERCCTSLWNEQLDRRYLIPQGHTGEGFWETP
jgi:hypothetical protein